MQYPDDVNYWKEIAERRLETNLKLEEELAEAKDEIHNLNSVIRDMNSELRSHTHG